MVCSIQKLQPHLFRPSVYESLKVEELKQHDTQYERKNCEACIATRRESGVKKARGGLNLGRFLASDSLMTWLHFICESCQLGGEVLA